MARSQRLRLRDVRDAEQLAGEACELWMDPAAWQGHVVERLAELLHGPLTLWVHADGMPEKGEPRILGGAGENMLGDKVQAAVVDMQSHGWAVNFPEYDHLARRYAARPPLRGVTYRRVELLPDKVYYRSELYQRWFVQADIHSYMASIIKLTDGTMNCMAVHRDTDDHPLTLRDSRRLGLIHATLAPHIGTRLTTLLHRSLHGLSPRQRQTLDLLLQGDSEKQVAAKLGISAGTVHEYVMGLYRHFNVQSRGELLAVFIRRRPDLLDTSDDPRSRR